MDRHNLFTTLKRLKGNARGCVYTEPLWGVPFNLYAPYASIYMLAFGLNDGQIGLITSVATAFQVAWTLLSGAITDKLGRKRTTLIFDILSWSVPTLIWALAQDFTYFLVAAVINSSFRVTQNSWSLTLVEDTEPDLLVDVYSWIYIAGLLSAFVAPLTGLFVDEFGLVPTMRGLYTLAFVMMTTKFLTMNALVTETEQGRVRRAETQDQSLPELLSESPAVLREILRSPATLYLGALMVVLNISWMIRGTFWSILAAEELLVPEERLALYPFARSVTMLLFFFVARPQLRRLPEELSMLLGLGGLVASHLLFVLTPAGQGWLLLLSIVLEGMSFPMMATLVDKMTVVTVDKEERARIMALLNAGVLLVATPFGWITGQLSAANRRWPFLLSAALYAVGAALILRIRKRKRAEPHRAPAPALAPSGE
jgi:MFS family permease